MIDYLSSDYLRTIEPQIMAAMTTCKVPGLSLGIIADGHLAYARGFGMCSVETPELAVTPDTVFRIGSVTKPLTGTLIMRLVQAGKVSLDDVILVDTALANKLANKLYNKGNCPLTYRQLLSHTAGLGTALHYTPYRSLNLSIPSYDLFPVDCGDKPGYFYNYSNVGINVAGLNISDHNPRRFTDQIQQQVFAPLGMTHTTFDPLVAATYRLAQSHLLDESDAAKPAIVRRPMIDNPAEYPCGFAFSTIFDLAKYVEMQLADGQLPDGSTYLDAEHLAEMRRDHALLYTSDRAAYGLTLRSDHGRSFIRYGHNGAIGKYGAWMAFAPELKAGIVMLCNRAPNFWGAAEAILSNIWDELERTASRHAFTVPEPRLTTPPVKAFSWKETSRSFTPYVGSVCGLINLIGGSEHPEILWSRSQRFALTPTNDPSRYEGHAIGRPIGCIQERMIAAHFCKMFCIKIGRSVR